MELQDRIRPVDSGWWAGQWHRGFGDRTTPVRLRQLTATAVVLLAASAVLLMLAASQAHAGTARITVTEAPVVTAADDLYLALNDMDAQLANVLLVGDATGLGITRADAGARYEQRRQQADADVQQLAAARTDRAAVTGLLDALGHYEALAATTMLLQQQHDTVAARAAYRSATALLRSTLLAQAQDMVNQRAQRLNADYRGETRRIVIIRIALAAVGIPLLGLLIGLQLFLTRRFRRTVNPGALTASLLMVVLLGGALLTLQQHGRRLHTAKQDAFDSIVALSQARAISYDANADESRYLLDPEHADTYQQAFLDKTQQILLLPGTTLQTYDQRLATAWQAYQAGPHPVGWGGAMGVEFRNITFAGERGAAELTAESFQAYQLDDRRIRELASTGRRPAAIALCTSYQPGGSNYAFDRYDSALSGLIAVNTHAFDVATNGDLHTLRRLSWLPGVLVLAAVILLVAGIRPRLAEYR